MATLTCLSIEAARAVGRAFGLDVVGVVPIEAGSVNSNYRIVAASGESYFLRIYEEQDEAGAAWEARLAGHLAARGVRTPVALPLVAGRGSVLGPGRVAAVARPAAMFPWAPGAPLCQARVDAGVARAVGTEVARLHAAAASFDDPRPGRFGPAELRAHLDLVAARGSADLRAEAARLARRLDAIASTPAIALPGGVVHGDLFRDNVLWDGSPRPTVIDFESAGVETFVYDLAVTALAWACADRMRPDLVRAIVEGYGGVRPLSPAERAAFHGEACRAAVRFTITRITDFEMRAAATPGALPAKDWRRFRARLDWLEAEGSELLGANGRDAPAAKRPDPTAR